MGGKIIEGPIDGGAGGADDGDLPTPDAPPGGDAGQETSYNSSGLLTIDVPANTKIYVNGRLTKSTGQHRSYITRNLAPGFAYTYNVKAVLNNDGQEIVKTKTVDLRAGGREAVVFDMKPENPVTSLTLLVPEAAKVTLGGVETTSTGARRVFSTSTLAEGEQWSEYKVVVTINNDGQPITKEQTISMNAGEKRELSFDFDLASVAAAR